MKIEIIRNSFSLYLDRDGVINKKKENDYIKEWSEFKFTEGALIAISILSKIFNKIIIVTNQRGIGKGVMSENDLNEIHKKMIKKIESHNGRIDGIYFCADLEDNSYCRKPNPGMAYDSKKDFYDINFNKSFMVGDQFSDVEFGHRLGMKTVLITSKKKITGSQVPHYTFKSLLDFSKSILNKH